MEYTTFTEQKHPVVSIATCNIDKIIMIMRFYMTDSYLVSHTCIIIVLNLCTTSKIIVLNDHRKIRCFDP